MLQETTHESTIRNWFTLETMPSAWKAADPIGCEALVQALQDKMLKAYNMGLLDGAARRKAQDFSVSNTTESLLNICLTSLLEAEYVGQCVNSTFTPLWHGDTMDARRGDEFIERMCIATGLLIDKVSQSLKTLHKAQVTLGFAEDETKTENTVSVA